jgi:hypothetical protein
VTSVEWQALAGNPALEPHEELDVHPLRQRLVRGQRIYPGATSPTDSSAPTRRKVRLVAAADVPKANVPVYFLLVDVDDPSATEPPQDRTRDAGPPKGNDNRDLPRLLGVDCELILRRFPDLWELGFLFERPTDEQGRAVLELGLSMQPGDNYRVVASCSKERAIEVANQYAVYGEFGELEGAPVSEMLTVWRKLHVDLDSMDFVRENYAVGKVLAVYASPVASDMIRVMIEPPPSYFREDGVPHFATSEDCLEFPQGRIMLAKPGLGSTQDIVRGEESLVPPGSSRPLLTYIDIAPDATDIEAAVQRYSGFVDGTYVLRDDDWWPIASGEDPVGRLVFPWPEDYTTDWMARRFAMLSDADGKPNAQAYVTVTNYDCDISPFVLHACNTDTADVNLDEDGQNGSNAWWAVHLTAAFQGEPSRDRDPNSEQEDRTVQKGVTDTDWPGVGDGSLLFMEAIRDLANGRDFETFVGVNMSHEVGHQFGLAHACGVEEGIHGTKVLYLMAGAGQIGEEGRGHKRYSPVSLDRIRDIPHPIQDQLFF